MTSFDFRENVVDRCIYLKVSVSRFTYLVLYVDNCLPCSNDIGLLYEPNHILSKTFEIKDLGEASFTQHRNLY